MSQPSKTECRQQARARLRTLTPDEIDAKSDAIREHLIAQVLESLPSGSGVALFGGLRFEVDLLRLLPELAVRNLRAFCFRVARDQMFAVEIASHDDLKRGTLGVWEPADPLPALTDLSRLTVILIPGLAFDPTNGARLGRGAGYYDRFLSQPELQAHRIGVGFDCQIMTDIPMDLHDVRIDSLVTETGFSSHNWFGARLKSSQDSAQSSR